MSVVREAFVVVEGKKDADRLRAVLGNAGGVSSGPGNPFLMRATSLKKFGKAQHDVALRFIASNGTYSLVPTASSLLSEGKRAVVVVGDADTASPELAERIARDAEHTLAMFAFPHAQYAALFAAPDLEHELLSVKKLSENAGKKQDKQLNLLNRLLAFIASVSTGPIESESHAPNARKAA